MRPKKVAAKPYEPAFILQEEFSSRAAEKTAVEKWALEVLAFMDDSVKEDHLDHEPQCGFRGKRGTGDASFTVKQLIRKRREHGLETWILFIDLVKAFDRVPRELLWKVLLKFGVPPKLVSVLESMHRHVTVQFTVDGVIRTLLSIIGVKQGDLLGPELFTFFMAAVMETWRSASSYPLPTFRTRRDFVMTGRRHTTAGKEFTVGDSEYL